MKKLVVAMLALVALSTRGAAASADSANWTPEQQLQIAINRCANAGRGNGAEAVREPLRSIQRVPAGENTKRDYDPGSSYLHNANNGR
jgi:hypothetical protein